MRRSRIIIMILLLMLTASLSPVSAQSGDWIQYGKPGTVANDSVGSFHTPAGVAVDDKGNMYVADADNDRIQKLDVSTGEWSIWGKAGGGAGSELGEFNHPRGVAVDGSGNVYVADTDNHRIQMLDAAAGTWSEWKKPGGGSGNGLGEFKSPKGIAVDGNGNLYVADTDNHRIQKFDSMTHAWTDGKEGSGASGFKPGAFNFPKGVAVDRNNNLYVADSRNDRIQKWNPLTEQWEVMGTGTRGSLPGQFKNPSAIAADRDGNLFVADTDNHRIQKLDIQTGLWSGWNASGRPGSGLGELNRPTGVAVDGSGNLYVADTDNHRVQELAVANGIWTQWGCIESVAGHGLGEFTYPTGVTTDAAGNLYVADADNNRIQKLDAASGTWSEWGKEGGISGQAPGEFEYPMSVAVDVYGNLYASDKFNNRIQKLDASSGVWTVVSGGEGSGVGEFKYPAGVAVDDHGNVYAADLYNNRIQKLDVVTGQWTILGSGEGTNLGQFKFPAGVAVDGAGNVYVADTENHRVQKLDAARNAWEEIGSGPGSGPGQFNEPYNLSLDGSGNIYVADLANNRIQMLDVSKNVWIAWSAPGNAGGTGLGEFSSPTDVAIDSSGNIYVADFDNNRIQAGKKYTPAAVPPGAPTNVTAKAGDGEAVVSFTPPVNDGGSPVSGYIVITSPGGVRTGGTSSPIKVTGLANGTAYTFTVVAVNAAGESIPSSPSGEVVPLQPSSGGESPGAGTGGSGGNASPPTGTSTIDVVDASSKNGGLVSQATLRRTTDAGGRKHDELTFSAEQALLAIEHLKKAGSNTARIMVPDRLGVADELIFRLPQASAYALAANRIDVELVTSGVTLTIPGGSLVNAAGDVYFRFVPVTSASTRQEIGKQAAADGTVQKLLNPNTLSMAGMPLGIETNMKNQPVTITLPLDDPAVSNRENAKLYAFIQRGNQLQELIQGEIVSYEAAGRKGIRLMAQATGTFTPIEGQPLKQEPTVKAYMKGYADGTFRPDKGLTRAEMAMILDNLYGSDGSIQAAYTDVSAAHWASQAIAGVTGSGLMQGSSDGMFHPEQTITRAEMATIAVRLMKTASPSLGTGFKDTAGHWAEASIAQAQAAGYITGYADGTFHPDQALTRAEAATMVNRLSGRESVNVSTGKWKDVCSGHWAFNAIQAATSDPDTK
ncbi:S-layer homology domain-containing protein [Paenibacillus chibensis]|uniref:S-layer homology domain-containing protein n=1 Tax=Paenibacillus chibensis TaxID=59846 RepID=A0ABU6PSX0_9BACL|nr:S-layer homology domain-containing protein [Paenibacillus chibensis]